MISSTISPLNPTPPLGKKDYPYPLYAPWTAVEAGKKQFREWLKKQKE